MNYKKVLNRRTFLKGAGGAVVGLPFLEEMRVKSVYAQANAPTRAFNMFFGLGFNRQFQKDGYTAPNGWCAPLQPLLKFEKKLAFCREVNQVRADGNGNAHYDGSSGAFSGTKMKNKSTTGGASLDEALRRYTHPNGMPSGMLQSLSAGTWWRRSDSTCRYMHSRKPDGSIVSRPYETPKSLFNAVFGGGFNPQPADPVNVDPEEARKAALKNSVLDSLVDQYRHFQSDAAGLGRESRAKISDHLEHVRALERDAASIVPRMGGGAACQKMNEPANSKLPHGNPQGGDGTRLTNDGGGIDITVKELTDEWRLMARIYATAVACDRARFGSLVFQSGGERIRLSGDYSHEGFSYTFADRQRHGRGGSGGCSHEWWHKFSDNGENRDMRAHMHLVMREIAYFYGLLDGIVDEGGSTVLDTAMTTISTESADGRHRSAAFELDGCLHVIGGKGIRKGNGDYITVDDHSATLYNTQLSAYGVSNNHFLSDKKSGISKVLR